MKRYLLITLLFVAILTLGAEPNQVTIKLTTSVPEVLIHGFLKDDSATVIYDTVSLDHAFDPNGVKFTYAVKTNTSIPMTVYASITPFEQQVPDPAYVNIDKIFVGKSNESPLEVVPSGYGKLYDLIDLRPDQGGMAVYAYTLTVVANQSDVEDAPAGEYKSTVSIGITTGN